MAMGRGGSSKLSRNKRTETQKRRIQEQPSRTIKNRRRRREKHLAFHPRDLQTLAALKKVL